MSFNTIIDTMTTLDLKKDNKDSSKKESKKDIKKDIKKENKIETTAKLNKKAKKYSIDEEIINSDNDVELDDVTKKYQKKSQLEHIKDLPDTYIGSTIKETNSIWNLNNNEDLHIIQKEFEYVPGLRSIIEEILVNAFDNMNRVNQKNTVENKRLKKVSYIKVNINREKGEISIENDGEGIDIVLHPIENIYVPEMIFGNLLTSGNYNKDEEKITGGKNGFGAKLTNIFSTYFEIETIDRNRKLKYNQVYRDNMSIKEEPIIKNYKETPYTRITFIPDYSKFNLSGMSENLELLIKKRTIDMFACSRGQLNIYFNNEKIELDTFTDYMRLYLENEYPTVSCKPNDRWEIGACMSPNFQFQQVSFTNGICTQRGGKHVDYIVKQITKRMAEFINKKKKTDIKESFIKDNLMVFVNATIVNPCFDSQTKDTLTTLPKNFGSECHVPDAFIEKLSESGIMERALALNDFRDNQVLKKTDGVKKQRVLNIPKLIDAHFAGTKKGDQCTLILTEGDSAKAMAVAGISVIPNGHDLYGIYPLRGKLLNVNDKEDLIIAKNKEICDIKNILALKEGKDYKDVGELRYGRIMLMTDSDVDGSHIKGLVINFLSKWISLMNLTGFMTSLLTPIVKVWKKGTKNGKINGTSFYTLSAYNDWISTHNGGKGYEIKYYKGLGSSTPQEGKEYFKEFKIVTYHWDEEATKTVNMAFAKDMSNSRKTWLSDYNEDAILDINQSSVSISDFINKDLIHFSNYDNHRSIPSVFDGLKPSLRKIMYCAFKRNLKTEIKVAQLAGYVSEHGAYHHGEASLNGAIINLAQNYVGTNNINLLMPEGQFGSRLEGGKDSAAPRYIFTYLSKITNILFNKEDIPLLKRNNDDGDLIEPVFYMPIIPTILVNGTVGIGTGWSTNIPQFNPLDIINNIKLLMKGESIIPMNPWYRGFTGNIIRLDHNKWLSKGVYDIINNTTLEITELPIGYWTSDFKELLDMYEKGYKSDLPVSTSKKPNKLPKSKLPKWSDYTEDDGKLIKSYKNQSSEANIKFIITFDSKIMNKLLNGTDKMGLTELEKLFHLSSSISCCNTMNLYDENNKLKNFKSPEAILEYYYNHRLSYYELRRQNIINNLEQDLFLLSTKARFILDVIHDDVKIRNVLKAEVIKQLETLKYPKMVNDILTNLDKMNEKQRNDSSYGSYDFLISMPIYNLTKEKVDDLLKEKENLEAILTLMKSKTDKILWEEDLKLFEVEYKKHMIEYCDYMAIDPKIMESYNTSKTVGKKMVMKKRISINSSK